MQAKHKNICLVFLTGIFSFASAIAQTYTHPTAGIDGTYVGSCMVNTSTGNYYDNGGAASNYSSNIGSSFAGSKNGIYRVFCPSLAYNCVSVTFNSFDLESHATCNLDFLTIGNGATQNSTLISIPGVTLGSGRICGTPTVPFTATSTDGSGCLSFRFFSNNSNTYAGWSATISNVACAGGPTGTDNSDCIYATPICSDVAVAASDVGPGLVSESCSGCTAGGENYSTWYTFTMATGGNIGLTIDPVTNSDDYDFALYGPGATCGALGTPIRCSYAATTGDTGFKSTAIDVSETVTGNGWVATLDVLAGETYYLMVNHWSPPLTGYTLDWSLTLGATFDCTLLPLTLTSFDAELIENKSVALSWETATEFNNDYFLIERSTDGIQYTSIGTVKGKQYSEEPTNYYMVDFLPYSGTNYYRLSQVDLNGNSKILKTTSVNVDLNSSYGIIEVYDISGHLIAKELVYRHQIDFLMSSLQLVPGIYTYNYVQQNGYRQTDKLAITR